MQRLVLHKLGSKFIRDRCGNPLSIQSISSRTKPTINLQNFPPIYPHRHCFTDFIVPSHSWRIQTGVVPQKIQEVFANTILKGTSRLGADCGVGFLRYLTPKRGFQFGQSFDPRRRGWQSWLRRQTTDSIVLGLIFTNIAVFMLWRIAGPRFMNENFTISLENFRSGRLHTVITYAFSHIDGGQLITNMIALYFSGTYMGRLFGPGFLLKLYIGGAVVGSVFYLVHKASKASESGWRGNYNGLGANGAVDAIMLLNIFLFPKSTILLDFIIPVPAVLMGIFIIGKDVLRILEGDSQVSAAVDLGGVFVAAVAYARIRKGWFKF
ncbi:Rhomboid protease [Bertholletia excelsa]